MMMRILALILLLSTVSATFAQARPPIQFIKGEVEKVRELLKVSVKDNDLLKKETDQKLKDVLNPVMNFERLSENALSNHWATLNQDQRADFVELFRSLVFHSYLQRIRTAEEAYTIKYVDQQAKGAAAGSVTAIAQTKTTEIELVFHVLKEKTNDWSVEDIVIDEVSLVENYREQFDKIIKKSGFDALIEKMTTKLTSIGGAIPKRIKEKSPAKK